jgi:hypothetical protein
MLSSMLLQDVVDNEKEASQTSSPREIRTPYLGGRLRT